MITLEFLHPKANLGHVGLIPHMLNDTNPMPAAQQLDQGYRHGGGWSPFSGFTLKDDNTLLYPGDPPTRPLAQIKLRDELIIIYEHAWVAVIQPDRTFEVCRMD